MSEESYGWVKYAVIGIIIIVGAVIALHVFGIIDLSSLGQKGGGGGTSARPAQQPTSGGGGFGWGEMLGAIIIIFIAFALIKRLKPNWLGGPRGQQGQPGQPGAPGTHGVIPPELQQKIDDLEANIQFILEQIDMLRADLDNLKKAHGELDVVVKTKFEVVKDALGRIQGILRKITADLSGETEERKKAIKTLEELIKKLREDLDKLKDLAKQSDLDALAKRVEALEKKLADLEKKLGETKNVEVKITEQLPVPPQPPTLPPPTITEVTAIQPIGVDEVREIANVVDAGVWNQKGEKLMRAGKYQAAIECFLKASEIDPNWALPWYNNGTAKLLLKDYDSGKRAFEQALELKKENPLAWCGKGMCLLELRKFDEAVKCADKALEYEKNLYWPWYLKGQVAFKQSRFKEAIGHLEKSLTYYSNNGMAFLLISRAYISLAEQGMGSEKRPAEYEEFISKAFDAVVNAEKHLGTKGIVWVYLQYAEIKLVAEEFRLAEQYGQKIVDIALKQKGANKLDQFLYAEFARVANFAADMFLMYKDYRSALYWLDWALSIYPDAEISRRKNELLGYIEGLKSKIESNYKKAADLFSKKRYEEALDAISTAREYGEIGVERNVILQKDLDKITGFQNKIEVALGLPGQKGEKRSAQYKGSAKSSGPRWGPHRDGSGTPTSRFAIF